MPGTSDCELIRDAFLAQPANALSSLAFVVAGLLIIRSRPVLALLASAVGVGSFLFHGAMPGWALWIHDLTLAALLAGLVLERRPRLVVAMVGVLSVSFALWPEIAEPITALLVIAAVIVLGRRLRHSSSPWRYVALALLSVGVLIFVASRSDGPLCDPASLLQGHAAWHVLAAGSLFAFARIDPGRVANR